MSDSHRTGRPSKAPKLGSVRIIRLVPLYRRAGDSGQKAVQLLQDSQERLSKEKQRLSSVRRGVELENRNLRPALLGYSGNDEASEE